MLAILGWLTGEAELSAFGTGRIPMAPSTAAFFLLLGGLLTADPRRFVRPRVRRTTTAMLAAVLALALGLMVLSSLGIHTRLENLGLQMDGEVAGAPVGHMSPVTAFGFVLAAASLWLTVSSPSAGSNRRSVTSLFPGVLLLVVSAVLTLAYLTGRPLLYESGTVPPALTTSLAFFCLAVGLLATAAPGALRASVWPEASPQASNAVLLALFVATLTGTILISFWYLRDYERDFRQEAEEEISAVAELKISELVQWRQERLGDAQVFSRNPSFAAVVGRLVNDPQDADAKERLQIWLSNLRDAYGYERVYLVEPDGREILSAPADDNRTDLIHREELAEAINQRRPTFLDFHRDPVDDSIHLTVLAPIFPPASGDGKERPAILAFRIDPFTYLYPLLRKWPTPSDTAETLLVREEESSLLVLTPLRFQLDSALRLRIPLDTPSLPITVASRRQGEVVEGRDYRGQQVLAAVRSVPDTPWILVSRMDIREVYAPLQRRLWEMIAVIGLLLASVGTAVGAIWQRRQKQHYRSLADVRQELKRLEWMLQPGPRTDPVDTTAGGTAVGNGLIALNRNGLIHQSVGRRTLEHIVRDYLDLLDTSAAVYEAEGAYALSLQSSRWCRMLHAASRRLCDTPDDREALNSGRWLCHESCWTKGAQQALATGRITDIACEGGLRIYTVPVVARDQIVGAVNVGYGNPPTDPETLAEIADKFCVDVEELALLANAYEPRPPFIVDLAKRRVQASAHLIGEIVARKQATDELKRLNVELEQRVTERTAALSATNRELESFAYSVSHDLRAPLRRIDGFSRVVVEEYGPCLNEQGRHYLERIRAGAQQMGLLIDDLLRLSRVSRSSLERQTVNLSELVEQIAADLRRAEPQRDVKFQIQPDVFACADPPLITIALENLLHNAWKFSSRNSAPSHIEFGAAQNSDLETPNKQLTDSTIVYYVRDDGAGFDMTYADKLFAPFQRLHHTDEFVGTGIGLATVQRIVHRHQGQVWAKAEPEKGATFFFSLQTGPEGRRDEE
ncbi:MAG: hypothetical protein Kow00129_09250 [Thermoleophilia bacterium]